MFIADHQTPHLIYVHRTHTYSYVHSCMIIAYMYQERNLIYLLVTSVSLTKVRVIHTMSEEKSASRQRQPSKRCLYATIAILAVLTAACFVVMVIFIIRDIERQETVVYDAVATPKPKSEKVCICSVNPKRCVSAA